MRLKEKYHRLTPKQRIYNLNQPIVGLSGGIASGKSSASKILKELGWNVICADELVKEIYKEEETLAFIQKNFKESFKNGKINFKTLRELTFSSQKNRLKLENYIHPKLGFLLKENVSDSTTIYDVPLLFEKNLETKFDLSICIYVPQSVQLERLIKRDHLSLELAKAMIDNQLDIEDKRKKADIVIKNTKNLNDLRKVVKELSNQLSQ